MFLSFYQTIDEKRGIRWIVAMNFGALRVWGQFFRIGAICVLGPWGQYIYSDLCVGQILKDDFFEYFNFEFHFQSLPRCTKLTYDCSDYA